MSPGFIMSGGVQTITSTCVPNYLGRAKVFSSIATDFGPSNIFLRRIILKQMVELWFLFSAYCPVLLYICSKFHENIDDRFKIIEWI